MYNYSQQASYQVNRPVYSQQVAQPYMGLRGRPVASVEEARASIIDFDGSVFFFPDLANKRIYTKQINIDGTSTLNMYELREIPVEAENPLSQYITREEFESVINSLRGVPQPTPQPAATPVTKEKPILNF